MENSENPLDDKNPSENLNNGGNELKSDDDGKSSIGFSLWTLAFALLISNYADVRHAGSLSKWEIILPVIASIYVWFVNYSIASMLREDSQLNKNGTKLLSFNLFSVIAFGIIVIIMSIGLAENNPINIVASYMGMVVLPCYVFAQLIVAVKLLKDCKALWLGLSIIAVLASYAVALFMTYDLSVNKSTENLYYCCYGVVTVMEIIMYCAYNSFFKLKQNRE